MNFAKLSSKKTGIWAALILLLARLLYPRGHHLIDLPLTSFSILLFLLLTKWYKSKSEYNILTLIFGYIFDKANWNYIFLSTFSYFNNKKSIL